MIGSDTKHDMHSIQSSHLEIKSSLENALQYKSSTVTIFPISSLWALNSPETVNINLETGNLKATHVGKKWLCNLS